MNRYKLADGSYSDQYKVGDKFVVVSGEHCRFAKGAIIELEEDDQTSAPYFKQNEAYEVCCKWERVCAYKENSIVKEDVPQTEELEAKIDNLEEYISELVKENEQLKDLLHESGSLKQQARAFCELNDVLTTHPSFRENDEQTRCEELVNTVKVLQQVYDVAGLPFFRN
jgi:predicted RNase H-like nuclease (RuvC/YqgF family)